MAGATADLSKQPHTAVSHLKPLTGLRFVAAMLVVAFHFVLRAGIASGSLFSQGYLGVNFFFLLSGFILVYTYVDPVGRMRLTPYDFWVARLARIYPVYLLGFVVAAGPYLFQHHSAGASIVTALADIALTQAWIPTPAGTAWNGPGWSLSAEAFFYLAFPFTVLYIARFTRRQAFVALGASWFISLGFALILGRLATVHGAIVWGGVWGRALSYNPLVRLPEFGMGMALGRLFILTPSGRRMKDRAAVSGPALISVFAPIGIVGALSIANSVPGALVNNGLFDPLFALLIYSLAFGQGPLAALLSTPLMIFLGEASYAIYILHYSLWDWMVHLLRGGLLSSLPELGFFAVYLCAVIGAAVLSLRFLERPARRAIRRAFMGRAHILGSFGRAIDSGDYRASLRQ